MKGSGIMDRRAAMIGALTVVALAPQAAIGQAPVRAACAYTGAYSLVANGARYAVSAPPGGPIGLVSGGRATLEHYTGCGAKTVLQLDSTGPGTLLDRPQTPIVANQLRAAGDLLLRFSGTATQDPFAPGDASAVRLKGTAVYAHVTTKGVLHGKTKLTYSTKTVQVANLTARLRVTLDLGGAFSLSCALPGPKLGQFQSNFTYLAVGVRNPQGLKATTPPSKNL